MRGTSINTFCRFIHLGHPECGKESVWHRQTEAISEGILRLGRRTGLGQEMRRGEIRWYKFGRPGKKRPVLILTRDSVLSYLGEVTVAPITTTVRDIPSEVFLTREDGMLRDCAVNCDHLQTVSRTKLGGLITSLSPAAMIAVKRAIRFALDL